MDLTFHGKDATIAGRVKTAASGRRIGRSFAMKKILAAGALLPVLCVSAGAAEEGAAAVRTPLWLCLPFAALLLSIAVFPLVKPLWWEKHQG